MSTVTILGDSYDVVRMPDGKYWLASNLRTNALGRSVNGDEINDAEFGRLYTWNEFQSLKSVIPNGGRLPTQADCTAFMAGLATISGLERERLWATQSPGSAYWEANQGNNSTGFSARGAGYYYPPNGTYYNFRKQMLMRLDWVLNEWGQTASLMWQDANYIRFTWFDSDSNFGVGQSVRIVWDVEPVEPVDPLGGYSEIVLNQAPQPMHQLSLKTESGFFKNTSFSLLPTKQGCSGNVLFKGELGWDFTEVEFPYWVVWWNNTIEHGTLPVTFSMCTGAAKLDHTVQFTGPYRVTHDCGTFVVTATATITNRPSGLASNWDNAYVGPPALYPFVEIGMPQWGYGEEQASTLVATSGLPTAALPLSQRGQKIKFDWKLDGAKFDYLVDWYKKTLNCGKRRFVFGGNLSQGLGPWLCSVVEDPSFAVDGCNFTASMVLFIRPVSENVLAVIGTLEDSFDTSAIFLEDSFDDLQTVLQDNFGRYLQ